MRVKGRGLPKDNVETHARFTLAAEMGHEKSQQMITLLSKDKGLPADFLAKARQRAVELLKEGEERRKLEEARLEAAKATSAKR